MSLATLTITVLTLLNQQNNYSVNSKKVLTDANKGDIINIEIKKREVMIMYLVKVDGFVVGTCGFDEVKKFESAGCICIKNN